jgi:hypothetical protein
MACSLGDMHVVQTLMALNSYIDSLCDTAVVEKLIALNSYVYIYIYI